MNDHAVAKDSLRKQALDRRDRLDPEMRVKLSSKIELAGRQIALSSGDIVSGYWPIRSEVDVRPLLDALRTRGARLCLPAIVSQEKIIFRTFLQNQNLVEMALGTVGPGPEAVQVDPAVLLLPLAAFDSRGHRIGYGAGFYDRAIARLDQRGLRPHLIGIAFDCQEVDRVPEASHDQPLDEILTESGLRVLGKERVPLR